MPESQPFLTILIPAYNEERRLPRSLQNVVDFLQAQPYQAEAMIVDDGSSDQTAAIVEQFAEHYPFVRLVRAEHGGKGHAVRFGMLRTQSEYVFLADADLAMPITELAKFLPPALNDYHVAIGSREGKGARRYNEPQYRHLMGRAFNLLVKILAIPGYEDTQCGFKCFHRTAVKDLFSAQTMTGFSFDVEVLYIALKRKYKIVEVPIDWYYQSESKVHPVKDTVRMFRDLWQIRKNDRLGLYAQRG
jgi:dolichyl-phosphate beta-glucosyltransferase